MKKWITMLLALALAMSCSACGGAQKPDNSVDLMEGVQAQAVDSGGEARIGTIAAEFGVKLLRESADAQTNTLLSPLSVLYALAMTANGADGQTLAQMEAVLGAGVEGLNPALLAYRRQLDSSGALSMANAIWFKDDPKLTVLDSFLQTNADYYGAGAYKAAFDSATCDDINTWVEENTDGMITRLLDEIPEDAVMYLVNALAFQAEWEEVYEEGQVRDGVFTTEDGREQEVEMMYSAESCYLEDELATGVLKYYKDRKYAFAALLPNEGVSVEEYLASLTGEHLRELLSGYEIITTYTRLPKFQMEYSVQMSDMLMDLGMTDAFDWTVADFSRMGSYEGLYLVIDRVLHKSYIAVNEQGTKAGAATAVEIAAEGAAVIEETRTVVLDRPFIYLIVDCEANVPIFIGTMMDAQQTQVTGE